MANLPDTDSVHIGGLTYETRKALEEGVGWETYEADRTWLDFDQACAFWFRLKYAPDTPELFPKGKWATLQRMEELIEAALAPKESASAILKQQAQGRDDL